MRKRFLPVYYLKMAHELKKGTPRQEIISSLSEKYGISASTVSNYLSSTFPVVKAGTSEQIDSLLWEKRAGIKFSNDRRRIARNVWASRSTEQRAGALKGLTSLSPEKRLEIASKRLSSLSPKQRSDISRRAAQTRNARLSPEEIIEHYRHLGQLGREAFALLPPEVRAERAKAASEALARLPREVQVERIRAAGEAFARLPFERRREIWSQAGRASAFAKSPEQRRESARKGWETRRSNALKGIEYVADLPELNLLSASGKKILFNRHLDVVDVEIAKYHTREDFGDIQGIANLAFFTALAKWDKKMPLQKLIRDQIQYDLYWYFSIESGIHGVEARLKQQGKRLSELI